MPTLPQPHLSGSPQVRLLPGVDDISVPIDLSTSRQLASGELQAIRNVQIGDAGQISLASFPSRALRSGFAQRLLENIQGVDAWTQGARNAATTALHDCGLLRS